MRTTKATLILTLAALAVFPAIAAAQQTPAAPGQALAITNARIVTVSGPVIPRGTVVVQNGKISAVGAGVSVPGGARVIDARGGTVYPGLIDPLTTLGLTEIPTVSGSVDTSELGTYNPTIDASVAVHPHSEIIPTVRVNGITTALTVPRGGFVAGQAAVVNLNGWTPQEMTLQAGAALYCNLPHWSRVGGGGGGGGGGGFGGGGGGGLARAERERQAQQQLNDLKDYIARARAYADAKDRARQSGAAFTTLREWEAMVPYVRGERPWIIPADTEEQIKHALAFAKDQKLKVILSGATDGWKVAKELAEAGVPVLINSTSTPRQNDPYDAVYANAAELAKAGAKFAFTSNSASDARNLPFVAALAVAYGLPADQALRAMTLGTAEILGIADRVGSIEAGKVANLVIAGGDILDVRTPIRQVIIAGQAVPMSSRHTDLYDKFRVR
jgi:imidazolonepropionase-like amidohydrolase